MHDKGHDLPHGILCPWHAAHMENTQGSELGKLSHIAFSTAGVLRG